MRRPQRLRPQVEKLESLALLSGVSAAAPSPPTMSVSVAGTATGKYVTTKVPRIGESYVLSGHGQVAVFDPMTVGNFPPPERFVVKARIESPTVLTMSTQAAASPSKSHGLVTLADAQGRLTLAIDAPGEPYSHFTIVRASGTFRGSTGSGFMALDVTPKSVRDRGTFVMQLYWGPPPQIV